MMINVFFKQKYFLWYYLGYSDLFLKFFGYLQLIVYLLNFNVDISIYIFVIFVLCNKSIFDLFGKFVFFKFIENKKLYGKIQQVLIIEDN